MKEARFEYKCRRCSVVVQNPCTGESNAHMILCIISLGQQSPEMLGGSIKEMSTHSCKDGGVGLSDLIGYAVRD